jgi:DsbC/DsbD-like thiol-disulfide interchange protein
MKKAFLLSSVVVTALVLMVSFTPAGDAKKSDSVVKVKAKLEKSAAGKEIVVVNLEIQAGWHLYANPVGNEDFESGQVVVKLTDNPAKIAYPVGKTVTDPIIGKYKVYEDKIEIRATLDRPASKTPLEVSIRLQSCNDKVCLPPATVKVNVP